MPPAASQALPKGGVCLPDRTPISASGLVQVESLSLPRLSSQSLAVWSLAGLPCPCAWPELIAKCRQDVSFPPAVGVEGPALGVCGVSALRAGVGTRAPSLLADLNPGPADPGLLSLKPIWFPPLSMPSPRYVLIQAIFSPLHWPSCILLVPWASDQLTPSQEAFVGLKPGPASPSCPCPSAALGTLCGARLVPPLMVGSGRD